MRRQTVALLLALAVTSAALLGRTFASADRPPYARGDSWTYRTTLTEAFNLSFTGNTTLAADTVAPRSVQGADVDTLELFLTGGGTFAGDFGGFGTIRGNWTVAGVHWWETSAWKPVRSYVRLAADGLLRNGPTTTAVAFELANTTTQRIAADTWGWPIAPGASGSVTASWDATENLTVQFQGSPPQSNETRVTGTFTTTYEDLRTERVTVPAGTFDADVIREDGPEGGHRLRWYAAAVGNDVREDDYNGTGARIATSELTAYRYAAGELAPPFPWLPVLVAALAVVAVALLVVIAAKARRRPPADAWMPPEPEAPAKPPSP